MYVGHGEGFTPDLGPTSNERKLGIAGHRQLGCGPQKQRCAEILLYPVCREATIDDCLNGVGATDQRGRSTCRTLSAAFGYSVPASESKFPVRRVKIRCS